MKIIIYSHICKRWPYINSFWTRGTRSTCVAEAWCFNSNTCVAEAWCFWYVHLYNSGPDSWYRLGQVSDFWGSNTRSRYRSIFLTRPDYCHNRPCNAYFLQFNNYSNLARLRALLRKPATNASTKGTEEPWWSDNRPCTWDSDNRPETEEESLVKQKKARLWSCDWLIDWL